MGHSAMKKVLDRLLSRPLLRPVPCNSFDDQAQLDQSFGVYMDNDADFLQWMDSTPWDPVLG